MRVRHGTSSIGDSNVVVAVRRMNVLADRQNSIVDTLTARGVPYADAMGQACKTIPIPGLLTRFVLTNGLYEQATHYRPEPRRHYDWGRVEH